MKFQFTLLAASLVSSSQAFVAPAIINQQQNAFQASSSCMSLEMARKPFISGNWKLNPQTKTEAIKLANDIAASVTSESPDSDVAVFVPYPFIDSVISEVGSKIIIGGEVRLDFG